MLEINILLAEDDTLTRVLLASFLEEKGFNVFQVRTIGELKDVLASQSFHIAILDQTLVDGDTISTFLEFNEDPSIKIICMTSNTSEKRKNKAIGAGVETYLHKPVSESELLTRITAVIDAEKQTNTYPISIDGITILDTINEYLINGDKTAELTGGETEILRILNGSEATLFTRDILCTKVLNRKWEAGDRSIDILIARIRKKLKDVGCKSRIISVRNKGYRFEKG